MKGCNLQPWLRYFATSQGQPSCSSGWLGILAHRDSWRSFTVHADSSTRLKAAQERSEVDAPSASKAAATPEHATARSKALTSLKLLERFFDNFDATPPVSFIRSVGVPTAMSWMRRRGPDVPHAVLYRLFRQRQIRLFDGEKIRQVSASRPLNNGDLLLYPNWLKPDKMLWNRQPRRDLAARAAAAATAAAAVRESHEHGHDEAIGDGIDAEAAHSGGDDVRDPWVGQVRSHAAAGPGPGSGLATYTAVVAPLLTPERVRRWVLSVHPGLLFLNKPAGVRVHGRSAGDDDGGGRRGRMAGDGGGMRPPVPMTLDDVMQRALRFGEADEPRLVHRLDQAASGVMVVARNADAATWLCAAFRDKAEQALAAERQKDDAEGQGDDAGRGRGRQRPPLGRSGGSQERPSVHRTYWAFLAGNLQLRQSGRISLPVVVDGVPCPAVTSYRVRATGCGVSWVELTPETGRRHQLRVHCARKLGAPIIGDERYGYRGLPPSLALRERLPPQWWALLGDDPRVVRRSREAVGETDPPAPPVLLHSRELVIKRPGKAALAAVAPLPRYVRELIEAACWPAPSLG